MNWVLIPRDRVRILGRCVLVLYVSVLQGSV
jgi:hypothetical protein